MEKVPLHLDTKIYPRKKRRNKGSREREREKRYDPWEIEWTEQAQRFFPVENESKIKSLINKCFLYTDL